MFSRIVPMTYVSDRDSSACRAGPRWRAHQNTAVAGCWRIYGAPGAAGSGVNNLELRESGCFILPLPLVSEVSFSSKRTGHGD